jgi:glucose/arabinose dehydrogenase
VVSAREGRNVVYVAERRGVVKRVTADGSVSTFLDLRSVVNDTGGEQGLLGLVFAPHYASDRHRIWVAFTRSDGALQVARLTAASKSSTRIKASTLRNVIRIAHPGATNHNGGQLVFDAEGMLLIGTGDGGGTGDQSGNAQNRKRLLGKILRIDARHDCGTRRYCIPKDNPYAKSTTYRREILEYGLRNPWRFSIDPADGQLWIGDVGQSRQEEIDRTVVGGARNFGWPCREGRTTYRSSACVSGRHYTAPVAVINHPTGQSIIGGHAYGGKAYAGILAGTYLFGDFVSGRIWGMRRGGDPAVVGHLDGVTSFGTTDASEIDAVSFDGRLYRLRAKAE